MSYAKITLAIDYKKVYSVDSSRDNMKTSVIAFLICTGTAVGFGFAMLRVEMEGLNVWGHTAGDSSLGPRSINWMAGIALMATLVICRLAN
jgi:hypothetical protein